MKFEIETLKPIKEKVVIKWGLRIDED